MSSENRNEETDGNRKDNQERTENVMKNSGKKDRLHRQPVGRNGTKPEAEYLRQWLQGRRRCSKKEE